ncbi:unnamed protein product [Clavelina lepadiformis]|uniref:Uncharacterized protein n=1 Tax=Clavelina lepadiformis TaxID=159417 RepID=A0ABP0FWP5_CLALP
MILILIHIDPVPTNTESYSVNVSSTSIDLCDGRNIGLDAAGLPEMPESLPAQPIDVAQPSSPEDANSSFTIISPVELLPMPKAAHTRQKRKSKRGATAILTSSPYKKQLAATNRSQSAVSGNSSKTSSSKKRSMKKAKVSRSSMQQKDTVDESDNNVDAECFYCNEMYSKSSENDGWIQYSKCMRWAHEACSGCNEEDDNFICGPLYTTFPYSFNKMPQNNKHFTRRYELQSSKLRFQNDVSEQRHVKASRQS